MDNQYFVKKTEEYVREQLSGECSGHDWWHVYRVLNLARFIAEKEGGELVIVELAALLHDIGDWKFHDGDLSVGPAKAEKWLRSLGVDNNLICDVCEIVRDISFKGAAVQTPMRTKEGMIVQDADRLDAIGAIGIARTFAYGGYNGNEIYNPSIKPEKHASFEAYKNNTSSTINHFYEKLLLLKGRMNTETGKTIAEERHRFMELFLERFFKEWNASETV